MNDQPKVHTLKDKIITFLVWMMLACAAGIIIILILNSFELIAKNWGNLLFFGMLGLCLLLQGIVMFTVNLEKQDEHFAVAPYAGKQKVGQKTALFFSAVMALMGIAAIVAGIDLFLK